MSSAVFNIAKKGFLDGSIDWDTDTIKAALVMSNFSMDVDDDNVDDITLDECDDSGSYARQALSASVQVDDVNDRGEAEAEDISFSSLNGDATRNYVGILIYKHVNDDTDSIPIAYIEFTTPIPATATQVDVPLSDDDVLRLS